MEEALRIRLAVLDLVDRHNHGGQRLACREDACLRQFPPRGGDERPGVILGPHHVQYLGGSGYGQDAIGFGLLKSSEFFLVIGMVLTWAELLKSRDGGASVRKGQNVRKMNIVARSPEFPGPLDLLRGVDERSD